MFIVALTGGIATGKSTVTKIFKENGVAVVDADEIARQVVEPGKSAWKKIRSKFGDVVLNNDKSINREVLGRLIFQDVEKRKFLNSVTHPDIHWEIYRQSLRYLFQGHNFIVVDLPLLFETGQMIPYIYKIITVICDKELQLKRLMLRNSLSEEDSKTRIAAQMPLEQKCQQSHFVIENSGNLKQTEQQALQILNVLKASKYHWKVRVFLLGIIGLLILAQLWILNYKFEFF